MTNSEALNWLASRAADAPITIRTADVDKQVYQEAVQTLVKAITSLEERSQKDATTSP